MHLRILTFRLGRVYACAGAPLLVDDDVRERGGGGIADDHARDVHPLLLQAPQDEPPVGVGAHLGREAGVKAEAAGAGKKKGQK